MTAEIISVGTELLLGNILNTNAQYLSRELAELGITVQRESTIGDNQGRLADFVNEAKNRCDLLVFTGGLGPTADDLTKETVAACYGDTLVFDESEWEKITGYFARSGRVTTPNNRKQAMVPVHGHKVVNHHGTAPGAWFEQDGHCAVLMPGVPHEMKAMWQEEVRPLLLALPTARRAIAQNPALLARDMIGMFAPVDDFVEALGLTVIGTVGEETPYDSARHDCPALLAPGTPVIVATVGYAKGEQIWVKARVKEVI